MAVVRRGCVQGERVWHARTVCITKLCVCMRVRGMSAAAYRSGGGKDQPFSTVLGVCFSLLLLLPSCFAVAGSYYVV